MNGFLAALDNDATAPVNGMSTTGNVLWPSPFYVYTYTTAEDVVNKRLFGTCATRFIHFARAIQLLWLVQDSVLADRIELTDPLITYEGQLVGQLEGVADSERHAVTDALVQLPLMDTNILDADLREIVESSITPADKLAAYVVHFGQKHGK